MNTHTQKPYSLTVSQTESQLIELSSLIGSIIESNANFTEYLARHIANTGKTPQNMTVSELLASIQQCKAHFNNEPITEPIPLLQLNISPTKAESLKTQHEIIGYSLNNLCIKPSEAQRITTKADTLELIRMLDDLPKDLPRKKSRFNVYTLGKAKKLLAERVTFEQARQYQACIVKFAGMEVAQ